MVNQSNTDTIHPWLDPVAVRQLAEQLMGPPPRPSATGTDAGFDDGFIGFADFAGSPPAASVAMSTSTAIPEPQSVPALNPSPVPTPSALSPANPQIDWSTRFCNWMRENFKTTDHFILNREGAVIFDESLHGRLHFLARSLALSLQRPSASAGHVHVKISAVTVLEIIPVATASGRLILGMIAQEPLSTSSVLTVIAALSQLAPSEASP
jgi:hypothetical protein